MSYEYAPVVIITLNRYDHLKRCVESLKRNSLSRDTDLFIGIDFPPTPKYEEGYSKVLEYVDSIDGFDSVTVVKHVSNVGPAENHKIIRNLVLEKYEKYIFSEDDNEFSPNYLQFMNMMLDENRTDGVLSVNGYGYPISLNGGSNDYIKLEAYCSGFGYGIWKEKWKLLDDGINMKSFLKFYYDSRAMKRRRKISKNQYCNFVKGMTEYIPDLVKDGDIRKVDLSFGLFAFFNNLVILSPVLSKVRNRGFDGTGVNCGEQLQTNGTKRSYRNYNYLEQPIDEKCFIDIPKQVSPVEQSRVNQCLNNFFFIPRKELLVTDLTYFFSRIFGLEKTKNIIQKIKKSDV